jgi:hypothetical protein
MQHIRPYPVAARIVIDSLGKAWVCPYCKAEKPVDGDDDITWVPVPIETIPQRYMCLGCCEDIHSTCASDNFEDNPYFGIVADAAKSERMSISPFRVLCLQQQISAGKQRIEKEQNVEKYFERLARLESLIKGLKL